MKAPSFYKPSIVGTLRHADVATAMAVGKATNVARFSEDKLKTMLLLVDPQLGFIEPGRALAVPGAIEDTRRTIEWIYRNLEKLTYIAASMDTHLPFQIFFPSWFVDQNGKPLDPFSPVKLADLNKTVFPLFDFLYKVAPGKEVLWSQYYLGELERTHKKTHTIWPYHTMLGTGEHILEPSLYEAILFHSAARTTQPHFEVKGSVVPSENYSIMETEVAYSGDPKGGVNTAFLNLLENYDRVYIAGQAKSHCVLETILSIVRYFEKRAPNVLSRIRILEDCTSPVKGFEKMATAAFKQLVADYDLTMVNSSDSIK